MIKKTITSLAVISLLVLASCKKDVKVESGEKLEKSSEAKELTSDEKVKMTDPNAKYASMDFDKVEHDFGKIKQGDKVETVFTFTNNGEVDLIITDAKGSCGCTVPEYPKTPIKPGEKASMKVVFNSAGKKGLSKKTVTIHANTKSGVERVSIVADIAVDPNKKA